MAPAIGMDQGPRTFGQLCDRFLQHPVGEPRVGIEPGCVRDNLAVVAVDYRRQIDFAVGCLDLGDVGEPLLVGVFGGEVPVYEVAGRWSRLALVGTVHAPSGRMCHEPVLGYDSADHLLRDSGLERGLDPAVPVTGFGGGERVGLLSSEPGVFAGVFVNAEPGAVVAAAARRDGEQAERRVERMHRPHPVDQNRFLPVRQAPQVGAGVFLRRPPPPPHQRVLQLQLATLRATLHVVAIGIDAPAERHAGRFAILRGVPVLGNQSSHSALAVHLDPMVHGVRTHAELTGGLFLPHAAQHQLNRLPPCLQRDDGFPHVPSITGILRQSPFQALPGRITQILDYLGRGHRSREIQLHRTFPLLKTEHTKILSLNLQENVRSPQSPI